jgi:hypothetical protein
MPGEVFDGSAPCGPAIVTPDEAGPHDAIGIALDLNGERMQEDTTAGLIFSAAFAVVIVLAFVPFIPDGGLRELYDRTLGYQATRSSPFSVWGQAPSLDWLQSVARVCAAALAIGVAFWPRQKTAIQVAALAAAVTIAVQLTAGHWFYFYVVWFLPLVLVTSFASQRLITRPNDSATTE